MFRQRVRSISHLLSIISVLIPFVGLTTTALAQTRAKARAKAPLRQPQVQPRLLKIDGQPQYVRGINLAWLNDAYGHDFGHSHEHPDWGVAFDSNNIDSYFSDMARMNVNVVRIFVFEGLEGLQFDADGYVESIEPLMLDNLDTTLRIAKAHGLHLYLCLANDFLMGCKRTRAKDITSNPKARQAYLTHVVKLFTVHFKGDPGIFAFDIMNEPEQDVSGPSGWKPKEGCPWSVMRSFIRDNSLTIHNADPKRLVSCGVASEFGENIRKGIYSGLGLDFYDYHEYRNDGVVPPVAKLGTNLPVIIGEFSSNSNDRPRDDELQKSAVGKFLHNIRDGGYAGAAYWDYSCPRHPAGDNLRILRGEGSSEWRPAAYVLRDFQWDKNTVERNRR
jgi:hypothetical protein